MRGSRSGWMIDDKHFARHVDQGLRFFVDGKPIIYQDWFRERTSALVLLLGMSIEYEEAQRTPAFCRVAVTDDPQFPVRVVLVGGREETWLCLDQDMTDDLIEQLRSARSKAWG